MSIPIIILAAGQSSRLGKPKQIIRIGKETLLNHTIRMASEVSNHIIVVLGSNYEEISNSITNKKVQIVYNESWNDGISSSIKAGINESLFSPKVIISVCDQPFLTADIFEKLISFSNITSKPIVASYYGEAIGVPILFCKDIYPELLNLVGDKGARSILSKFVGSIVEIPFPNGDMDIDTEEDLEKYINCD